MRSRRHHVCAHVWQDVKFLTHMLTALVVEMWRGYKAAGYASSCGVSPCTRHLQTDMCCGMQVPPGNPGGHGCPGTPRVP